MGDAAGTLLVMRCTLAAVWKLEKVLRWGGWGGVEATEGSANAVHYHGRLRCARGLTCNRFRCLP